MTNYEIRAEAKKVGIIFLEARKNQKLSQLEFAAKTGVNRGKICDFERGVLSYHQCIAFIDRVKNQVPEIAGELEIFARNVLSLHIFWENSKVAQPETVSEATQLICGVVSENNLKVETSQLTNLALGIAGFLDIQKSAVKRLLEVAIAVNTYDKILSIRAVAAIYPDLIDE